MSGLAEQQAALVRALVAGADVPPGFDTDRVTAVLRALLRKRAGDVARHWPVLLGDPAMRARFATWAGGRPKTTSFGDGLAFACELQRGGELSPAAAAELRRARRRPWPRRR